MGISLFRSSYTPPTRYGLETHVCPAPAALPRTVDLPEGQPRPDQFVIERLQSCGPHVVAIVRYPHAHNYEGRKILLYLNKTEDEIRSAPLLDPHFTDTGDLAPFARFEPSLDGWLVAVEVAESMRA